MEDLLPTVRGGVRGRLGGGEKKALVGGRGEEEREEGRV